MPGNSGVPPARFVSDSYIVHPEFPNSALKSLRNHWGIPVFWSRDAETFKYATERRVGSAVTRSFDHRVGAGEHFRDRL
jgi:hypothetical protein